MGDLLSPDMPKPEAPTRMPDPEDPSLVRARRRRTEQLLAESTSNKARTMSKSTIAGSGSPAAAATTPYVAGKLGGS